jgi:carboxylate-amine ligase
VPEIDLGDPDSWRGAFQEPGPLTVGIEEEVMVLDGATLDLAPHAQTLVAALADPRFKLELPAAQLELVSSPAAVVAAAAAELSNLRRRAAEVAREHELRLGAAGVHPFAAPAGVLNDEPRYVAIEAEFGEMARRQLVFGLHVHVRLPGADRSLAVYNTMREYLPLLAAVGANAPFYDGGDTGLASVRSKLSTLLPRQGVPPAFTDWEHVARTFRFGAASGAVPDIASWWWEARLHPAWGTIEVRVPDAQTSIDEVAALAALIHTLVAWLGMRYDSGNLPPLADPWRIEENRWSACRWGVHGEMADLRSGARRPTSEIAESLIVELEPFAEVLSCERELERARLLARRSAADDQRETAAEHGIRGMTRRLADRFEDPVDG